VLACPPCPTPFGDDGHRPMARLATAPVPIDLNVVLAVGLLAQLSLRVGMEAANVRSTVSPRGPTVARRIFTRTSGSVRVGDSSRHSGPT